MADSFGQEEGLAPSGAAIAELPEEEPVPAHPLAFLPNLLTLGNGACGFAAVYQLATLRFDAAAPVMLNPENVAHACWLILLASCFDGVDGMAARWTKSDGEFGGQLDSLCDAISFGVAPGMLVAMLNAQAITNPIQANAALIAGGVYMCCVLLRLARFNVENTHEEGGHLYFKGLPSPASAAVVVSLVLLQGFLSAGPKVPMPVPEGMWHQLSGGVAAFLPVMAIVLGGLMVATFRYPDLPKHYLRSRHPGKHLALLALLAIVVLPPVSLPVLLLAYTLFVPVAAIWQRVADQLANGAR